MRPPKHRLGGGGFEVDRARQPLSVISCIDFSRVAAGGEMIPGYEDACLNDLTAFTTDKER